jgi:iron complex outermembrane recepter protein
MKPYFMAVALAMLCPAYIIAQSSFGGKIIDAQTNEALMGVNICIKGSTQGTTTDYYGKYNLSLHESDTLLISYIGYQKIILPFQSLKPIIKLQASAASINEFVISASREGQNRTEVPVAMSVISKQLLSETKATSLDQVLNKVTGVYMVDLGNEQHTMAIRQPINYKSLFLYLEDGIPIRPMGNFNHNALIEINMAALKNIEIIRGPSSSLYGSEAIGGAINFTTQAPSISPTAKVQAEVSSLGNRRTDFSFSNTHKKSGIYIGGYYGGQRNGFRPHSDFDKIALTLRWDYRFNNKTNLTTTATKVNYQTEQTGGVDSADFYGRNYTSYHTFSYRKVEALRMRSTLEHQWNESSYTFATIYFRNNLIEQNPFYGIRSTSNPLKARGEINQDGSQSYGTILQHRKHFAWLRSKATIGLSRDWSPVYYNARFIDVDRDKAGYFTGYTNTDSLLTNYNADLVNTAAYAQLEFHPLEKLKVTAAGRYDRLDYDFKNHLAPSAFTGAPDERNAFARFTPRIGVNYDLKKDRGIYGNYSVGFAPPGINDLYRGMKVPVLEPSIYKNYELGGWLTFSKGKGYVEAAVFRMDGTNQIINMLLSDGSYENRNAGQTAHQGIEYTVKYEPYKNILLRFSGTNALHTYKQFNEKGKDYSGKTMQTAPRQIINAEISWKPALVKNLRLSAEWQHLGPYFMDQENTETYEGYNLFNFRAGYAFKSLEYWLNIMNVSNELYATTVDKSAWGKNYRPGAPRAFHIGVAWNFSKA